MKTKMIYAVIFLIGLCLRSTSYAAPKDSIEVRLTMPKHVMEKYDDFMMTVEIQSKRVRPIILSTVGAWGVMGSYTGYLKIEMQEEVNGKFQKVESHVAIDNFSAGRLDTLRKNDTRQFKEPLAYFCDYVKGRKYRVRVHVEIAIFNKKDDSLNQYSNWYYFEVNKKDQG